MQKASIKVILIFKIPLNTFCEILEVAKKINKKKKYTHHLEIILRNNYYLAIISKQKKDQILANESLIIKMKSNTEKS